MTFETDKIKINLDGKWKLDDLSDVTKNYIQLYAFAYSLLSDLPESRRAEVDYIYAKFPWRGGYSTVNFYNQIYHKIPKKLRPDVIRIEYASPGFILLQEILAAAVSVAAIVKSVCASAGMAHDLYRKIQKASIDHKLSRIDLASKELSLSEKQIKFCEKSSKELQDLFAMPEEQRQNLDRRVEGNSFMKMKILLSVYRRIVPIAEKQAEGMLTLEDGENKGR